ncbi:hypothetical protein [Halarcobacter ebronensis]|uniref:Uncharacterized protein n=1 Tax=Halarcobacter ebronensis TaxID=1462615 RepID=A0A4Q1ANX6_9BACT|nr:hypothetical protein [Halarcobacter ebronensis]QKF81857.1 hypothetical protein AEBR_1369 [Halarcobacter ebronensis]RXK02124.1 hypothetical protein CRV07_14005 [Halarcobacter ebronensis]
MIEKLKDLEAEFLEHYPKGLEDEEILKIVKRFKSEKFEQECKELFKKENFPQPELICSSFVKIVSKSPLISLFEKPKLRDAINSMGIYEKDMFSLALEDLLYGNKKDGFESLSEILIEYKLAKWTIITLVPYYLNRKNEYFIKPTTTKDILKYFEINTIVYKPKVDYEFYKEYKKFLDNLKKEADSSLTSDNAGFTGFLRMSLK